MERFTENRASSFNDAGLWRKLLDKAKKGTTTESYFAADIVDGSLQTTMFAKLGLPAEFLEHHRKNLTENIILEAPDGRKWPVMLGLSWDSKPCLLQGWREFATDCNLAANDQILFFLWEDSHFLVQVFDSNHNIKRRGGGTTSAHIARTTFPQVAEPIQSSGFKTTRPTGVEKGDYPVADFNANIVELLEGVPEPESAPSSGAEEDQGLSMMRARNLNRNTKGRGGGELHMPAFRPPWGNLTLHEYILKCHETAEASVTKWRKAKEVLVEKIPEKRARQAPTDRSKAVFPRTRWARGMKNTSPDDPDSRSPKSVAAGAREAATAAANKAGVAPAPASDPVTPLPVEAPRQVFKRPQPRHPRQLYYSKRRPVTQQEREAALEAGQRYAVSSYNRTHVMQLRVSQVYCGNRLLGTFNFAQAMELPLQGVKQVCLYDKSGCTWDAEWRGEHPKRTGLDSAGWTRFVLDHYLEEGDVCVFELPDPKVCNISVTVFPVVPLTKTPNTLGWRDHYTMDEPVVPTVVPAVVLPGGLDQATLRQSSSFEKEDSGVEGKRRRLSIDKNSGEEEMNKTCEEDKSSEKDKGSEKKKSCVEEARTEGIRTEKKNEEKSVEEKRLEEKFGLVEKVVEEKI